MTGTYRVAARPREHGWELHVGGGGVTQVADLSNAEQQVRDFLQTVGVDSSNATILFTVDEVS